MKNSETQNIEKLLQNAYKNLWNKSADSPFNIDEARQVYLQNKSLTIIDPDFKMIDKEAPTKVQGYENVMPKLAAPWDMVKQGGILEIYNIETEIFDNRAFVSFDAKGKMTFTNNESIDLQRNATQMLVHTDDGWRIAYEHVS
ncbi:nuclear transport factor 2 family protein [Aquimarina sp. U1-2]|uniref:nuclear transport factor 2 family protein n=1 Tax=Aquimarina sp. U1-2 TaxID=2823141 RepID=UPI001AECE5FE|nr:nuclear transport factor 2 family protein [Aquimarina sp. U1-2]MBP2831090.1 nuclear transport factor 2 family protein [Aquimarina sp. U1-2]